MVNGSKLKIAFGPYIKSNVELTPRRTIERHVDEIIEEVAKEKTKSLGNTTRDKNPVAEAETSERSMSRDITEVQPTDKSEFLTSEVEEIIEMIQGMDQSEECGEQ